MKHLMIMEKKNNHRIILSSYNRITKLLLVLMRKSGLKFIMFYVKKKRAILSCVHPLVTTIISSLNKYFIICEYPNIKVLVTSYLSKQIHWYQF